MEIKKKENQILKNRNAIKYQNEGIFLIFNKLSTEYNLYINGIKKSNLRDRKILILEISFEEKLSLLNKELSESTFDKVLLNSNIEDEKDKMKSI